MILEAGAKMDVKTLTVAFSEAFKSLSKSEIEQLSFIQSRNKIPSKQVLLISDVAENKQAA